MNTMSNPTAATIDDQPVWAVIAPDATIYGPMTRKTAKAWADGLDDTADDDGEGSRDHLVVLHRVALQIAKAA